MYSTGELLLLSLVLGSCAPLASFSCSLVLEDVLVEALSKCMTSISIDVHFLDICVLINQATSNFDLILFKVGQCIGKEEGWVMTETLGNVKE